MRSFLVAVSAVFLWTLFLSVNTGEARGKVTTFEVFGACMAAPSSFNDSSGACTLKNDFCSAVREITLAEHASQKDCVRACHDADNAFVANPNFFDCKNTFRKGRRWCIKFCRSNYD